MVRQEDRPARRRAVLVLDSRASAPWRARGDRARSSGRRSIASVAAHLAHAAYAVHLVSRETVQDGPARRDVDIDPRSSRSPWRPTAPTPVRGRAQAASPLTSAGGLVIAVATDLDEQVLRQVASLRQPGGTGCSWCWTPDGFSAARRRTPHRSEDLACIPVLRWAGWGVTLVRSGDDLATVWSALSGTGTRGAEMAGVP